MVDLEDPLRAIPVDVSDAPDGLRVTLVEVKLLGIGVDDPDGVLVLKEIMKFIIQTNVQFAPVINIIFLFSNNGLSEQIKPCKVSEQAS